MLSSDNYLKVFFILLVLNFSVTLVFFYIIQIICSNKLSFLNVGRIFLEGGILNQVFIGTGIIYRSYILKNELNIFYSQYLVSQFLFSIIAIISYSLLAISFGFLHLISLKSYHFIIIILSIIIFSVFTISYRKNIYPYIRLLIPEYIFDSSLIKNIKKIRDSIRGSIVDIFLIFISFILISFFTCYAFYMILIYSDININYLQSSFIWISSFLIKTISTINFIGFFELALGFAGRVINIDFTQIVSVGLLFRIISLITQLILIMIINLLYFFRNNDNLHYS